MDSIYPFAQKKPREFKLNNVQKTQTCEQTKEIIKSKHEDFEQEFEGQEDSERRYYLIFKKEGNFTNKFKLVYSIKGRDDSQYFKNKFIIGEMIFYDGFPKQKPEIRVNNLSDGSVLQHLNVYENGMLCIPQVNTRWSEDYTFIQIIEFIDSIIHYPNESDVANQVLQQKEKEVQHNIFLKQIEFLSDKKYSNSIKKN